MELWQWRPARDADGDLSKPTFIQDFETGPQIMEEILINSEAWDGALNLDLGTFATGGLSLIGAPTDWPMTIMEVANLLISTGELDLVITPTDAGGGSIGQNMGTLDAYNGDYGTDLQSSVIFEYGTGLHNVRRLRWNEDMTQLCNKLRYYGGPRMQTAQDPAGDQHWCWNVTGTGPCFVGPAVHCDDLPLADAEEMIARYAIVEECLAESRDDYDVRMDIKIWDALGDDLRGRGRRQRRARPVPLAVADRAVPSLPAARDDPHHPHPRLRDRGVRHRRPHHRHRRLTGARRLLGGAAGVRVHDLVGRGRAAGTVGVADLPEQRGRLS